MPAMLRLIFSAAFRPFFLLAGLFACVSIVLWLTSFFGIYSLLPGGSNPITWHSHEMLFGLVGAAIGGFIFTAVASWTGRPPIHGAPLVAMALCWFMGRIVMSLSAYLSPWLVATLDLSYLILVLLVLAQELYLAGNRRNYILLAVIGILLLCNLLYHLTAFTALPGDQWGTRGATMTIILLISVIGGRVIPAFSRNWFVLNQIQSPSPTEPNRFDFATIGCTLILIPLWLFIPSHFVTGILLLVAALLHAIRVSRWQGLNTWREPLLLVLHVGYCWIPIGFLLIGVAVLMQQPVSGGIHALTVGAMTTMIMAVSSRAALGHTGRTPSSSPVLTSAFILITMSALLRVLASQSNLAMLIWGAGLFWLVAFLCYLYAVLPLLIQPRVGELGVE
jgi:uncharacterized protein involved in response to NO|tara:strand:+ start:586 stop:1761 length:1176 start_codon:yes stop_codon:yes gene_type:complete